MKRVREKDRLWGSGGWTGLNPAATSEPSPDTDATMKDSLPDSAAGVGKVQSVDDLQRFRSKSGIVVNVESSVLGAWLI